jgi:hypothetical protein
MELNVVSKRHGRFTVLIDEEDYSIISGHSWHIKAAKGRHSPGARTTTAKNVNGKQTTIMMHRMIMGLNEDNPLQVDHINGNGLDKLASIFEIKEKA